MAESKKETAKTETENKVDVYRAKNDTTILLSIGGRPSECFFSRGSVIKVKAGADINEAIFEKIGTEDAPAPKKDDFYDPTI